MKNRLRRAVAWAVGVAIVLGVGGCSDCDLKITTASLPDATVGVDYRFQLDSDCGGDFWFVDFGVLPPGIQLQDDGDFRGVPSLAGIYIFSIGVVDFGGNEETVQGFSIDVAEAP